MKHPAAPEHPFVAAHRRAEEAKAHRLAYHTETDAEGAFDTGAVVDVLGIEQVLGSLPKSPSGAILPSPPGTERSE